MKPRTLVVEIAIGAMVVALGVCLSREDETTTPVAPLPPVPATAPVATPPAPAPNPHPAISVRDSSVLCIDKRCLRIARYFDVPTKQPRFGATPVSAETATRFGDCELTLSGTLTCGRDAPIHVDVRWGREQTYVRDGDRLAWLLPRDLRTPSTVHWMPPFRDGIHQLSIGYRTGCVLTRSRAVWCWSDPRAPARKIDVPANVVEIATPELFTLCVRTEAGAVWCTPATDDTDLACDPDGPACGKSQVIEETKLEHPFDPVTKLMRPFRRIAIPLATRLVAAEYFVDVGQIEPEHPRNRYVPTCTLDGRGRVTCFSACASDGVAIFHITGVPAVREARTDLDRGYLVTEAGALWSWAPPPDRRCGTTTIAAIEDKLPSIVQLAAPLYHMGPYPRIETTRCALTGDGPRCWQTDPIKLEPIVGFDPTKL